MDQKRPLSVRNGSSTSGIPKPVSRLPLPGSLTRKRPAETLATEGKENVDSQPPVKKSKISTTSIATRKPAGTTVTKKPVVTAAKKPMVTATKKPAVKSTANSKPAVKSAVARRPVAAKPAAKTSLTKKVTDKLSVKEGSGKQKRSAWDLKGRLQDMEVIIASERGDATKTITTMSVQLNEFCQRLNDLESVRVKQEGTIKVKQEESSAASQKIKSLEEELDNLRRKYQTETESYEQQLGTLRRQHTSLQDINGDLERNLLASRSALSQLTTDVSTLQCRYDAMKITKDEAMTESSQKSSTIASLEGAVQDHLATIAECNSRIRGDEMTRRKLHNTIQELKGNIRVFCRVRPVLPGESMGRDSSWSQGSGAEVEPKLAVTFPDVNRDCKKISLEYLSDQTTVTGGAASPKAYNFEFDRVFDDSSTQDTVFDEISQLVQSVMDGYNVCIFAYGQTGSGKTFTMEGPESGSAVLEDLGGDSRGMIPRAVEQVFASSLSLREHGWEYKLEALFLEIYNETIRNLLASTSSNSSLTHDIKIDPSHSGGVYITNITPVVVTSQSQVATLLERGARNRAVAATNCNERSSRSHSVFQLHITGKNEITGEKCKGTLNLVDLAGSERLAQSGSMGERLKETKNINKSLSNLGQVIMALANKDQHIPYRNSKLTYLLQNSLGGNSKTLMFVNMSPRAVCIQETLCSLRFATKVNQCNIGTAKKSSK